MDGVGVDKQRTPESFGVELSAVYEFADATRRDVEPLCGIGNREELLAP